MPNTTPAKTAVTSPAGLLSGFPPPYDDNAMATTPIESPIDVTADSAARAAASGIRMVYADATKASGDVNVTGNDTTVDTDPGLGGDPTNAANGLDLNQVEQVNYLGSTANDDTLLVEGTTADDTLSVTPIDDNSANAFLDGAPLLTIPPDAYTTNNPGVAAAAAGPDISLDGLVRVGGLTMGGGGSAAAGDRLVVNAPTEDSGGLAATSGFGGNAFGSGSTIHATNDAFDTIDVTAIEKDSTMLNFYLTGEAHYIDRVSNNVVSELMPREDFTPRPYLGTYFYRVNTTKPPIKPRAIFCNLSGAYCIDLYAIIIQNYMYIVNITMLIKKIPRGGIFLS